MQANSVIKHRISLRKFEEIFENFNDFVFHETNGGKFIGFSDGIVHERESYKQEVREKSLSILKTSNWEKDWIGKGEILTRINKTLEIDNNNLVDTTGKYGPTSVPHIKMIKALEEDEKLKEIEGLLFNLFKSNENLAGIFTRLTELIGKKYSTIAFLFFLKNDREFLPISTTNFEFAFENLNVNLKLSRKCSWTNYKDFLNILEQIKTALEVKINENVNLIDAHSFCWIIGYKNNYQKWLANTPSNSKKNKFNSKIIDPINNCNRKERLAKNSNSNNNIDWDLENKRKRIKGRKAEELVLEFEKERLIKAGRADLANKIEDYSSIYGHGFDILSWDEDESERNIEVKSSSSNGFIITRNELNKSETNPNYWIYIVNEKKDEIEIKQIKKPSLKDNNKFRLEPKDYYVSFNLDKDKQ